MGILNCGLYGPKTVLSPAVMNLNSILKLIVDQTRIAPTLHEAQNELQI